jgi:fatty-acyl-CoA synthase
MYPLSLAESYVPAQTDGVLLDSTVGGAFVAAVTATPGAAFLTEMGAAGERLRSWTYAQAGQQVEALAQALRANFTPGERIVIWAPNSPDWILLQFAAALAGLILVPANPAFRSAELRHIVEHAGAVAIFSCEHYRGAPLLELAAQLRAEVPQVRGVFDVKAIALPQGGDRSTPLPAVLSSSATQIQYTSGTTGRPKGAVISHHAFTNNARLCFERLGIAGGDKLLHFMPLFHTGGCGFLLLGALQRGVEIVLADRFDPSVINALVEQRQISVLLGVPTMMVAMLETLKARPRDFSTLRLVLMGGSPVSAQLVRRVRESFGCRVAVLFGQTETSSNMTCTWPEDSPEVIAASVGQPLPHTEMAIRHPHSGAVMAIDQVGEICVRSYTRLIEYHRDPQATARAIDADGWLHTGDLGSLDSRGYLAITGRLKDMIIRGGENIYPAEIEAVLAQSPQVAEAAVFGIPDEHWGEVVCCCVRPAAGQAYDAAQLADFVRRHLAGPKVPLHWRAVDSWPLTGSGKIQKFALRDEFLKQRQALA